MCCKTPPDGRRFSFLLSVVGILGQTQALDLSETVFMYRPKLTALSVALSLTLSACLPTIQLYDQPAPASDFGETTNFPDTTILPPADYVAVRLVDGSPGLALWCDVRSDCINAARLLCDNRQSIRSEFDIDRASPGAAQYFSASPTAAHQLTVSCPV